MIAGPATNTIDDRRAGWDRASVAGRADPIPAGDSLAKAAPVAEAQVLGSLLLSRADNCDEIWELIESAGLASSDFDDPRRARLFRLMAERHRNGQPVALDSIAPDAAAIDWPDADLQQLCDGAPLMTHVPRLARTVLMATRQRRLAMAIRDACQSLDNGIPPAEVAVSIGKELDRYESAGPYGWPELRPLGEPDALPPFPADALPEPFASHVLNLAEALQVPTDLPGILALGLASIASSKRFRVRVGGGHFEPCNLYLCALLPPGERKSAAFAAMLRPAFDFEREHREAMRGEVERAQGAIESDRARVKHLRDRAAKADDVAERDRLKREAGDLAATIDEPPAMPTLTTGGDATPEALAQLAGQNGGRIAQVDPEAGAALRMFNAYQSNGSPPNVEFLLKAHAGDYYNAARVGRTVPAMREPALTLVLTGQPETFAAMKDRAFLRARGLLARFLVALPLSCVGSRNTAEREPDPAVAGAYAREIRRMLATTPAATPDNPDLCHILTLQPEARQLWEAFASRIERAQRPDGELVNVRDFASKLAGAVGRIAGILAVMSGAVGAEPIEADTMAGAVRLGDYFLAHWRAVNELASASREDETARRILRWIERHAACEFSTADMWRDLRRGGLASPEDLAEPLADLVGRGYLRPIGIPERAGPGRMAAMRYTVRPGLGG